MTDQEAVAEQAARVYHRARSRENLSALVEAMEPLLRTWLKCEVTDPPEWADGECLQAGRIKLLDVAPMWSDSGVARFVAFAKPNIVGAMKNTVRDLQRRRTPGRDCSLSDIPEEMQDFYKVGDTEHALRLTALELLSELPDTLRIIARMYYLEGYTTEEIARIGGFTVAAVRQLLQQVLVRIQAQDGEQ